ncbi:Calycin-like protein [Cryphonectria parasitica EP155]|uniref:Calycin-like protein n=1 Tax=Cryphonectria parasitica (strain ATCC 38755 / EP155) TaxID=660469 RepID=A0A9P4YA20_CRYP1|nr:Calycin-like protein [Cryphonectria parasitica EP155]KAF3769169.1 Calycin-like protein [Cryphonectria parasitica EP155]
MHSTSILTCALSLAAAVSASSVSPRATTSNGTNVVSANWDGECFYPISDSTFDIDTYLGVWYQVAGYTAIFDAGCKCITANYTLNENGTVHVVNQCQELGLPISIEGTATAADAAYGDAGVFVVTLEGFGDVCPGPNYIVQEYVVDDYAIVQSPDFSTLFVLSREQNLTTTEIDTLVARAVALGSDEALIVTDSQSGCLYT